MLNNTFSYGGISSAEFGLYCELETHTILPAMRKYSQEIPGLDGEVDYGIGGYSTRIITVPIYYVGSFENLRANREQIMSWLAGDGTPKRLIFAQEPQKYYKAKIHSEINFENSSNRNIGVIEFECNPPWQYLTDGTLLSPEEIIYTNCEFDRNQFIKEFTTSGNLRLVNKGGRVKPKIKLYGNIKSGIMLLYKNKAFQLNGDFVCDGVEIDCANETAKRISNGDNIYNFVDEYYNDFFELDSGNCQINLSMTGLSDYPHSVTLIVEFETMLGG